MEKDKYVGICKVGEKGQIVIPVEARKMFNINPGDSIIVLCDKKKGIALVKSDVIEDIAETEAGTKIVKGYKEYFIYDTAHESYACDGRI